MNKTAYLYFGDDLFHKLDKFADLNFLFHSKTQKYKIFNSDTSSNSIIDDVFLGWSYIIYKTGSKYNHVGFLNLRGNFAEVFEDYHKDDLCITSGGNKVFAVSPDGKLYHYSTQNPKEILSTIDNINHKIKSIVAGDFHTYILLDDGSVFNLNLSEKPPLIPLNLQCPIVEVACGKEHVVFLSNTGQIFSYGCGSRGQLGHGTIESQNKPLLLEALDGIVIKAVACGGWHTASISDSGDLYMWGWNESGQLGLPSAELHANRLPLSEIETVCCLPKIVELEEEKQIASVSCGSRHTAILTEDSEVWTWGWNEYGQLGHEKHPICDKPCKVVFPSQFLPKNVKCAFWSTLIAGVLTV